MGKLQFDFSHINRPHSSQVTANAASATAGKIPAVVFLFFAKTPSLPWHDIKLLILLVALARTMPLNITIPA